MRVLCLRGYLVDCIHVSGRRRSRCTARLMFGVMSSDTFEDSVRV